MAMDVTRIDRSIGELFSDLSQQTTDLIKQEMRLAKAELTENLSGVGRHAMMIGVSLAFGLAAVIAVAAAIALLLVEIGVEPWGAALITALVMGLAAYTLAQAGISALRKTSIAPVETIHSLKETTQWLKNGTR
jgi:putative copper export protein